MGLSASNIFYKIYFSKIFIDSLSRLDKAEVQNAICTLRSVKDMHNKYNIRKQ